MRLYELRKQRGLKQSEIAAALNISVQRYSCYETSKRSPDPEMLVKLADYFGVSIDYLLEHNDEEVKKENMLFRLRDLRKEKGLTLKEMASQFGTSHQVLSRYELGIAEPDFKTIIDLADYFSVSLDYLLGRDDNKGFSPAENAIGFNDELSVSLSDDEYELILTYRKLGNKKGSAFQRLVREHMDKLLSI